MGEAHCSWRGRKKDKKSERFEVKENGDKTHPLGSEVYFPRASATKQNKTTRKVHILLKRKGQISIQLFSIFPFLFSFEI